MTNVKFTQALEAFAVGDALGLPTEFMTREEIVRAYPVIDGLPNPELSRHHSDLPAGSVSDDTEQNLYLIDAFREKGVSTEATVYALLKWIEESRAVEKRFIGPSSLKSLRAIQNGGCLLYTSDAADDLLCVVLGGRRIIKKKTRNL